MTSSPDLRSDTGVLAPEDRDRVRPVALAGRELRSGGWTRLGGGSVLGDAVTEHTLSGLVQQTQSAARAQGYATGWAEGRRAALQRAAEEEQLAAARHEQEEQRREAEHRQALASLARAAVALEEALVSTCARVEAHATDVAVTLTEQLVGHELAAARTPGVDAVRRALALAPGEPVVRIRIAPDEAGTAELDDVAGAAVVVPDPLLQRGDALVETAEGVIDARVSSALQRVLEVLAP